MQQRDRVDRRGGGDGPASAREMLEPHTENERTPSGIPSLRYRYGDVKLRDKFLITAAASSIIAEKLPHMHVQSDRGLQTTTACTIGTRTDATATYDNEENDARSGGISWKARAQTEDCKGRGEQQGGHGPKGVRVVHDNGRCDGSGRRGGYLGDGRPRVGCR